MMLVLLPWMAWKLTIKLRTKEFMSMCPHRWDWALWVSLLRRGTGRTWTAHFGGQSVITKQITFKKCGVAILRLLYRAQQMSKPWHCLTTKCITSPQEQKTNNFHQIDLDANGAVTNGGKWHLFPIFLSPPSPCALLCKLSGVFVTAWCWRKQQQAELWIANVPWGGRPRFDILNKLQIRQAGRGSAALLISLPPHSQIRGLVKMGIG